jgi:hypothetical protein
MVFVDIKIDSEVKDFDRFFVFSGQTVCGVPVIHHHQIGHFCPPI